MQNLSAPAADPAPKATPVTRSEISGSLGDAKAASEPKGKKTVTAKKSKGEGSRSGMNARKQGTSDDEIEELSAKQKALAAVTYVDSDSEDETEEETERWSMEAKVQLVSYITDVERYKTFKISQPKIYQALQKNYFPGKTVAQVRRCWNGCWDRYKAVRRRQLHTAGGDGDAKDEPEDDSADGKKKKRKKQKGFSKNVLDAFEASSLFQMIDSVAHDQEDVVRQYPLSSHRVKDESSNEEPSKPADPGLAVIEDAFRKVSETHNARIQFEECRLELEE
ncbi:hypothetical protein M422DRAFT_67869 [Sphaerobolus stellatus SS14]|uniref:Uncharacterized protein n=1 Tax=Sphaerobolus stellatus (strain SS14) TaxID=990650 RepID=A0A0C9VN50_SPHS4|nr:hypothetical protein M422DRAFT_67869 [Sphaerobolus stellatus SS14]